MVVGHDQNSSSPYESIYIYKWDGSDWIFHQKIEYPLMATIVLTAGLGLAAMLP